MSQSRDMLCETATRLFARLAARREESFGDLWGEVQAVGLADLLVAESDGGFGGDFEDAFAVARLSGLHALALPLVEAALAARLSAAAWGRLDVLTVLAPRTTGRLAGGRFTGLLPAVPFGRHAAVVMAVHDGSLIRLETAAAEVTTGHNPAGEQRDGLRFHDADVAVAEMTEDPFALGALLRAGQIAGALDACLSLTIEHANGRSQFGRVLSKFQAVQQALAIFAEEAAAANCAGQAAALAADRGDAAFEIAAAKLRANSAAATGAATAHQIHGAIGFTAEHGLHPFTRRLAAWRAEFGGDRHWAAWLGRHAASLGPDGFWPELTRRSDAA